MKTKNGCDRAAWSNDAQMLYTFAKTMPGSMTILHVRRARYTAATRDENVDIMWVISYRRL